MGVRAVQDVPQRVRVGLLQVALGPSGEADTEPEGLVTCALLVDDDVALGSGELEQAGRVQPARPTTEHRDSGQRRHGAAARAASARTRLARVTSSTWSRGTTAEEIAVKQPGQQYWRKAIGASM